MTKTKRKVNQLDNFYIGLGNFKGQFHVNRDGSIRMGNTCSLCPIEVVADVPRNFTYVGAKKLGLTPAQRLSIMQAADDPAHTLTERVAHVRKRMLQTLGLTEISGE